MTSAHPPPAEAVKVIVAVPTATPVTNPVLLTVATEVLLLVQDPVAEGTPDLDDQLEALPINAKLRSVPLFPLPLSSIRVVKPALFPPAVPWLNL